MTKTDDQVPDEFDDDDRDVEINEQEIKSKSEHLVSKILKDLELRIQGCENVIISNQKYIKKIWDRIEQLEENFKLLIESK